MLGFRMEEISELINDINIITKVNCVLYDKDFHILHNYKNSMCRFCSLVRTDPACSRKCLESDMEGFDHATSQRRPYRYQCHMGLTETVTPIVCEDVIVGYMMAGQNLQREHLEAVKERIAHFPNVETRELLLQELERMKLTTDEELDAMSNLVQMCASYLYMKKLIRFNETPPAVLLRQYIEAHLEDDLSIEALCKIFNMSKSSLYLLSRNALGCGVTEYIRQKRMQKACELLTDTSLTIGDIAERVGYADTNYFNKVFKRHTGITPGAFRRNGTMAKTTQK